MYKYAVLTSSQFNKTYLAQSNRIATSELRLMLERFEPQSDIECRTICGINYVIFQLSNRISKPIIEVIGKLSFYYALFEVIENESVLLAPIECEYKYFINPNISNMLKYTGKTNELFTRLMINLATNALDYSDQDLKLLDPLAGKGTTLFEGLARGYSVYGVEIDPKPVLEAFNFIRKFLETERYKFNATQIKQSGENKCFTAKKYSLEIFSSKEQAKKSEGKSFEITCVNSAFVDKLYKPQSFDILVCDLPYGVQHSSVVNSKQYGFTRNPKELLLTCIDKWKTVLKKGGVMVLAWNTFLLSKEQLIGILEQAGLKVFTQSGYQCFEHRVEQAIKRDVILAKK